MFKLRIEWPFWLKDQIVALTSQGVDRNLGLYSKGEFDNSLKLYENYGGTISAWKFKGFLLFNQRKFKGLKVAFVYVV